MTGHSSLISFQWFDAVALLLVLIGGLGLLVLKVAVFGAAQPRLDVVSSALRRRRQPGEARPAAGVTFPMTRTHPFPPPLPRAFDPDAEAEAFLADLLQAFPTEEELANT